MKLLCIDNSGRCNLKKGQIYEGELQKFGPSNNNESWRYILKGSRGMQHWFTWRFKEIKSLKLNKKINIL
jgi:hypothetical protein